ncbi:hypothetical protein BS17DRAFT_738213, partial [Gyrodon lividus]
DHDHGLPVATNVRVETTEPHNSTAQSVPAEAGTFQHVQIITPDSGDSNGTSGRDTQLETTSTTERHLLGGSEGYPTLSRSQDNPYADFDRVLPPPPARSRDGHARGPSRRATVVSQAGLSQAGRGASGIDWIVPVEEKGH